MESQELVKIISKQASALKAENIKVLELQGISSIADFFVVCHGNSDRQVRAIAERVIDELKKVGRRPLSIEGREEGHWVLVDYGEVVLHVFDEESRKHYDLEGFWDQVPRLRLRLASSKPRKKKPSKKKITKKPAKRVSKVKKK